MSSLPLSRASCPDRSPRFLVGQDEKGQWVAVEAHGLAGGVFRSRADALHYALAETLRRHEAITISEERVELRL